MILEIIDGEKGPLCPISIGGDYTQYRILHQFRVRILDAFYDKARTEEAEFLDSEVEQVYMHVAYKVFSNYMYLYTGTATPKQLLSTRRYVQSYWWQCPTCGFVLPANEVSR